MSEPVEGVGPRGELRLPAEILAQLGLRPDECLRRLDVGVRTVLLERTHEHAATALPWDRELVMTANVRSFPLADVLGLVHAAGKSGFLYFTHGDHAKAVYLHRGEVVFASSNLKVDRLGECLLRAGVITLEQLREAERLHNPPARFGLVFVERGILTPRELWHGVKYQVEEIVRSLFAYTGGTVYFWEGEVQPDNVVRLSLPTRRLVAEGVQRRDELLRFLALLEDPRVELTPMPGADANLASTERDVLEALREEPRFSSICRRVGIDPLSAARTVQLLRLVGALRIARAHEGGGYVGEGDLRSAAEDSLRRLVSDHVKLLAELVAPIVAVEGAQAVGRRLGRVLHEIGERHPDLLAGVRLGAHCTLDPEELTRRTLRLPGDRRREVAAALGELVSYLEFELRHHPRITDPEPFLVELAELRATIDAGL
jgi:hypothetical protein